MPLQYLRDVCAPRQFDEIAISALVTMSEYRQDRRLVKLQWAHVITFEAPAPGAQDRSLTANPR
jgi:hypothetical protein